MSESENAFEEFWALIPEQAVHPNRVPILEAFRWIRESLSPLSLIDLFDGLELTMWEAEHHLRALAKLGVLEPDHESMDPLARRDIFDLPYRLTVFDNPADRPGRNA